MSAYQPKTGQRCHCKPGVQRDNYPACEGTGLQIDFAAIRRAAPTEARDACPSRDDAQPHHYRDGKCVFCGTLA